MATAENRSNDMSSVFWLFFLSVVLIGLTFLLAFLIIPMLLFPSASVLCNLLAIYKYRSKSRKPSLLVMFIISLPIPAAIATFLFWMNIIENGTWH